MSQHGRNREPSKEKAVFVEGIDEVNVIESILRQLGIDDVDVLDVGGKDKLAANFENALQSPGFKKNVRSFAIIQDADRDPKGAFERVRSVLAEHKFLAPTAVGTFVESGNYKVGILVLPGGDRGGYLEDLFLDAYNGTPVRTCVENFARCSEVAGCTAFDTKRRSHALLAALDAPEPRLGRAFESGRVNGNSPAFDVIRGFLAGLN